MADLQASLALRDEGSLEEVGQPMQPHAPPVNPGPSAISAENWQVAEMATQDVLRCIQPTVVSEQRRKGVVEYMQKLLKRCIGTEVFPYGSFPLKAYLPYGDIDLTAIGYPNSEDSLVNEVWSVLDGEQCKDAEFKVMDVQYIKAEVKLIKCMVKNIVVDISMNQIGGLSTLCFLEKVDQKIGKDHLFKRSIILIKAWCYYESRILGAYHGLISTYALETLVLYVFHLFHKSLDGPLAVLYRFLDFYSKFEWDKYCVSLQGLIYISSLPKLLVADMPDFDGSDLLFSKEFIEECVKMFSAPVRWSEIAPKVFSKKHLNIVDPLKQNNNLGRSVSQGSFYRIRNAFTYGAEKLCGILKLPTENIVPEVGTFFRSTLKWHGTGERPGVLSSSPNSFDSEFIEDTGVRCFSSSILTLGALPIKDFNALLYRERINNKISDSDTRSQSDSVEVFDSEGRESASLDAIESPTASPSHDLISDSSSGDTYYSPLSSFHSENKEVSLSRSTASEEINYETELLGTSWNSNLSEQSIHADCSNEDDGKTRNSKFSKLSNLIGEFDVHYRNLLYALDSQGGQVYCMNQYIMPVQGESPDQYQKPHSWNGHYESIYKHVATNNLVPARRYSPTAYSMNQSSIPGAKDVQKRGTGTYIPDPNSRSYREQQSPGKRKVPTSSIGQQDRNSPVSDAPQNSRSGFRGGRLDRKLQFGSFAPVPLSTLSEQSSRHEVTSPLSALSEQPCSTKYVIDPVPLSALSEQPVSDAPQNARPGFRDIRLDGKLQFGSFGPVPLSTLSEQSSRHEVTSPNQSNATARHEVTSPNQSNATARHEVTNPNQSNATARHEVTSPNQSNATATAVPVNQRRSSDIQFGSITEPIYMLNDEHDFPPLGGTVKLRKN